MNYGVIIICAGILLPICSTEDTNLSLEKLIQNFKSSVDNLKKNNLQSSEDAGLKISEYLEKYNYALENYEITTEDGFILTLHRIPAKVANQPAALFVHGLVCGPLDWVTQGPNTSLALLMADLGYDIWLLGTRGTAASMKHLTLNSSEEDFWNFSFHEKGYYDVAASVDFIRTSTGLEKIILIGHSEGTSDSMALTTTRPEYNDKLSLIVMLSPIGYMGGLRSPFPIFLAEHITTFELLFVDLLKIYGIPYNEGLSNLILSVCSIDGFTEWCNDILKFLCGDNQDQTDLDYLLVFVSSKPAGISLKQIYHYLQEINAATFRQYDYGVVGNLARYGATEPPNYNVSLISAPVAGYYASNDLMSSTEDVETLLSQLPNVVDQYLVEYEYFNHLDFLTSKDVKTLLYQRVISTIQKIVPL